MAGSCVEYAPRDRPLVETDPAGPSTLYGACKHAAGIVSGALAAAAGASLAWARIFHLHGPNEDARRLIPWVAGELRAGRTVDLTDGTQVRDHLHVADVASGLVALLAPEASGVYNVCSGEPVTLRAVLETVGDIVGGRPLLRFGARPHRPGETMFLAGDSGRLRALGWSPRFGLGDGLRDALGGGK
jgi:nucleoside-diphosphate-sugar epimerase